MVLLVTSDNEQFHADKEVVERSVLIKNMLEGIYRRHFQMITN
jgi:S-phase kinase-associated protein 1